MRFQGEILHWREISQGKSYYGVIFPGEILHWGEISAGKFYTGLRFPGEILHWVEISVGKILLWDIKRGKSGPRVNLPPGGNPTLGEISGGKSDPGGSYTGVH